MNAREITNVDLCHWIPVTKLYQAEDGTHFVVEADLADYDSIPSIHTIIRRPTVIQHCNELAVATDLTPDHAFDPGTTHEQALALAGYQITQGG